MYLIRFRRPLVIGLHLLLIPLGYLVAFQLRFDFEVPSTYMEAYWATAPYLLALRLGSFALFGLYHGWWRHVGMRDLLDLVKAVTLSSALFLAALFLLGSLSGLPRSVLVLDWVVAIFIFGGARFAVRGFREGGVVLRRKTGGKPALILGAGDGGDRLLRQLLRHNGDAEIAPIALLDDDLGKRGMRLHGVPVLGPIQNLPEYVAKLGIGLIVIAIPSASREEMQRIVEGCTETGVEFKIVPSMRELMDGRARLDQLRSVQIDDLLGREPVRLNLAQVSADLEGRIVLITGGAGSIGSELARQVAAFNPKRLIIVDQAESPLYFTHLELTRVHSSLEVTPIVADIADCARIDSIFARYRPEYVFHAAAYKHVPLMEQNVVEAVRNNVFGTLQVAECAARFGAKKFILVSTDKAVNPSSVMGATKRIAERIVLGWPSVRTSGTDFRAVRFGNVLGSDGSVVPLFKRQIAEGGPLTVTHRDVTRYFMTIPEAVQLVLQAAALPEAAGRISMLDMGEPVRIIDLAENLIRLSGLRPYHDLQIVFTGMRPGEKLHEELMSTMEETVGTSVEKIRVVQTDEADSATLERGLDRLIAAITVGDVSDLRLATCALVPECVGPLRKTAFERLSET